MSHKIRHSKEGLSAFNFNKYSPESVVLEITNRCNLRCPHCASNSGPPRENEFSYKEWCTVLEELKALGTTEITLLGGEIFLNPDWYKIAKKINALQIKLNLITNGLLVTDRLYEQMTSLDVQGFGISLDGSSPEVYKKVRGVDGFDKAFALLERFVSDGYDFVNAITTFSILNWEDFDNFIPLLENTGINWQVQLADSVSKRAAFLSVSIEEFEDFINKIINLILNKSASLLCSPMDDFGYFPLDDGGLPEVYESWYGCMAGISVLGIRANGDVLPCLSMGDDFIIANIRDRGLTTLWQDDDLWKDYRQKHTKLTGDCAKCVYSERCRAGCAAMAYTSTGTIFENKYCIRQIQTNKLLNLI